MSDSDSDNESTTGENDTLEDETAQPASGDRDAGSAGKDDSEDGEQSGKGFDPGEEPDDETKEEIEEERQERLDPENRPDDAEVDNTQRDFDVDRGKFTDSEDYDENEPAPFSDPEDPNNSDEDSDDSDDSGAS